MKQILTERAARDWVTAKEWGKGESYVRGLSHLTVRPAEDGGTEYRAQAHGSEAYRVSVTVQGGVVMTSDCSCPVGHRCKHVAALLNKLTRADARFAELPSLGSVLDALEEHELRRLVRRFLDKAPELEGLVYAGSSAKTTSPDGTPDFVPRIRAAFDLLPSGMDYEEWTYSEEELDTTDLDEVALELDRLRIGMTDWTETQTEAVTRAYIALLDGVDGFYDGDIDYGLDDVQAEGVAGLYDIFTNAEHLDGDLREDALEALRTELVNGRLSFDDEFVNWYGILRAAEQESVFGLLKKLSQSGDGYKRKKYLQALIDLRGGEPSDEDTEAMLRAENNPTQLVAFLLERGRVDEAAQAVRDIKYHIPFKELRPLFQAVKRLDALEDIALKTAGYSKKTARLWLFDVYAETQRPQQAYELALKYAFETPQMDWFSRLKKVSLQWATERDKLIKSHWKSRNSDILELMVSEGLTDLAYDFVQSENTWANALVSVAQMPNLDEQRAALLYIRAAKSQTSQRSRTAYAEAAAILKNLIPRLGKAEAKSLVETQFPERKSLPALRDELYKAGLI